jgi:DNA-binding SARP family transcriptional activator/tetratricopeptide (TPR) repeat protein
LGGFRLQDGAGAEIKIGPRKGRALLAYLALRAGETQSRETLAALLWEEADGDLARTSLRQALAAVRKCLPDSAQAALRTDGESVAIDPAVLDIDVTSFQRAVAAGTRTALQEAAAHYRGDLLNGFDIRSPAFDEWVSSERAALRRQACEALQKLTSLCAASEDVNGALTAATRLVALEPLNEAAHRAVMEQQARRNAYAEALRQYRVCRETLERELGVAPEPATEALYRDIMRRRRVGAEEPVDGEPQRAVDETSTSSSRREARPELRDVTILVARLPGLLELEATADPEEAQIVGTAFEERVRRAIHELGGRTDRRVTANVLAVFGAPAAQGNELERAARAALLLRDICAREPWPVRSDLQVQIGLAQGQVLCGPDVFPITGRPAHLAHTLAAAAAPGEILMSAELHESLGDRVRGQRVATQVDAAAAWALHALETTADTRPFVGRRPELAMILAALDRCKASKHGRAIVIRGEAGIGKTRLVDALKSAARAQGVAIHTAQVFDFGQSPGRRPITILALSLLGLSADAAAAEKVAAVRRVNAAARGAVEQAIFLSDLIDAPLDTELAALEQAMDIATRQRGRALALAHIIESAARTAQLLVVEDVHWADNDELARLGEIAAVVINCPILFVMTTRIEGDPIGISWRARARGCPVTTVELAPLADDEAHELAAHFPQIAPEVVQACVRRSEGHPLFLDQLLRAASSGQAALPGSVRMLVLARADRLSAQDHRALQASAVLGHRTALAALCHVIDESSYDPVALLDSALMRGDGVELEFAHALLRDAIYESTLKSQRREWHRRAAAWFAERDAALHADHLAAAEDERAPAAYLAAARAEQAALRFERALALANKAHAIARESGMLHETTGLLGELLLQLGRTHDALASYRDSLDFALDQPSRGRAWFGVASALRIMDRHEEALEALDQAEAALGEMADARTKARIYSLRGNLCFPLGRLDACLRAHEQAYAHAARAQSPPDIARALGGLGDAYYQRGHMITARGHFVNCTLEASEHGLAGVLLANLPMVAITQVYCGEVLAAQANFEESLELARRIGDLRGELLVHLGWGANLLLQMQTTASRARADRALELAQQLGARRFEAELWGLIAQLLLAEGERDTALSYASDGLKIARESGMSYCGPILLAVVARSTDNAAQRAAMLAEGETLLAAGCVSHSYLEFYNQAIEVSLQERMWPDVRRYATALESYTAAEPLPWAQLLISRARVLVDVGEGSTTAQTQATLAQLCKDCERMNMRLLLPALANALAGLKPGLQR